MLTISNPALLGRIRVRFRGRIYWLIEEWAPSLGRPMMLEEDCDQEGRPLRRIVSSEDLLLWPDGIKKVGMGWHRGKVGEVTELEIVEDVPEPAPKALTPESTP